MTGKPLNARKRGVQTVYTERDVSAIVQAEKAAGKSLRVIASEYGFPVNHADIERILQGHFPHNAAKRKALGLPPVCVSCGQRVRPARPGSDNALVKDNIHGTGFGKLGDLVRNFNALEADARPDPVRTYSRQGRRVI